MGSLAKSFFFSPVLDVLHEFAFVVFSWPA
jgi:hypothetical protein